MMITYRPVLINNEEQTMLILILYLYFLYLYFNQLLSMNYYIALMRYLFLVVSTISLLSLISFIFMRKLQHFSLFRQTIQYILQMTVIYEIVSKRKCVLLGFMLTLTENMLNFSFLFFTYFLFKKMKDNREVVESASTEILIYLSFLLINVSLQFYPLLFSTYSFSNWYYYDEPMHFQCKVSDISLNTIQDKHKIEFFSLFIDYYNRSIMGAQIVITILMINLFLKSFQTQQELSKMKQFINQHDIAQFKFIYPKGYMLCLSFGFLNTFRFLEEQTLDHRTTSTAIMVLQQIFQLSTQCAYGILLSGLSFRMFYRNRKVESTSIDEVVISYSTDSIGYIRLEKDNRKSETIQSIS